VVCFVQVVESIRNICPHVRFVEAECTSLDPKKKTATFSTVQKESSSRAIKDGERAPLPAISENRHSVGVARWGSRE